MAVFNANGNSTINVDNSAGVPKALTAYVKEIAGLEKIYAIIDKTALLDTAEASHLGIQLKLSLTIGGDFNDIADGPHVVLSGIVGDGTDRTVTIVLDGVNQISFEALCTRYATPIRSKDLVQYEATLVSDGAVTIA